jgi:DNA-binding NtrC family response regulator
MSQQEPAGAVLIVDDEPRLRQTLAQMVQRLGYLPHTEGSAEAARRALEAHPLPDILLLDLQLPAMQGMDLFNWMSQHCPQVRVIVLTGFGSLESAQESIRLGVVEYLTKPCTLGELERALGRARQVAAATPSPTRQRSLEPGDPTGASPTSLAALERRHILDALHRHQGNRRLAAAELGISERALYYKLARFEVE